MLELVAERQCDGVVLQSDQTFTCVKGISSDDYRKDKQQIFLRLSRIWKTTRSIFTEKGKLVEHWSDELDGYFENCAQVY